MAFIVGKLIPELRGIEKRLTLLQRHSAQVSKLLMQRLLFWIRQAVDLLNCGTHLPALRRRQSLPRLYALQCALALLRRHRVQLPQAIGEPLLFRRRQAPEARLVAQRALLRLRRKILMLLKPLRQVLRPLRSTSIVLTNKADAAVTSTLRKRLPARDASQDKKYRPCHAGQKSISRRLKKSRDTPWTHRIPRRGAESPSFSEPSHRLLPGLIGQISAGRLCSALIRIVERCQLLQRLRVGIQQLQI